MASPIDLHAHSGVSTAPGPRLSSMRAAVATDLGTVAITDPDSTAGWQRGLPRCGNPEPGAGSW
jgi:hypothetical protein